MLCFARLHRAFVSAACFCIATGIVHFGSADADDHFDFAHRIIPILKKHCVECHAGAQKSGGFSINTQEELLAGGDSGNQILPTSTDPSSKETSELLSRITSKDLDFRMPPKGDGLTAEEIETVRAWLDSNLAWEPGFTFGVQAYEPPLFPRRPELPDPSSPDRTNPVDRILDAYRASRGLEPIPTVSDSVFVRRVYLDLIGLLPTAEQTESFVADASPEKYEHLVQTLLAKDQDYAEHWLTFWNDLLRNDYTGTGFITGGRTQITAWLYDALLRNKPYDQMARELIAPPSGESAGFANGIRWRGEVSAGQTVEIQFAQSVGQAFLGINLKCASCHDSFIDRWRLKDAYGLAAIYSNTPLKIHRCDKPTGETAQSAWLFPELGEINPEAPQPERLQQLAALMTTSQNGRFSRTIANRFWHRLMGRGIVHPTDAMQSQPWNEDLLDYLSSELTEKKFDLKQLLLLIATSKAYRSETETIESRQTSDEYVYRGPQPRRLTAEQFVDTVWQLTGAAPKAIDAPIIRPALPLPNGATPPVPQGKWIWSESANAVSGPAAGETLTFRTTFQLDQSPKNAFCVITCDNQYRLLINGKLIGEDANWENVEGFSVTDALHTGENEIVIVGTNGGSSPNPAVLYFDMQVENSSGVIGIATSPAWQITASIAGPDGKFSSGDIVWKNPIEVPGLWGDRLRNDIVSLLARNGRDGPMVRASLVKSDFLMRSLGRPNRDQIVSVRPTELTTLEAMDLSNGQTLADWLRTGAEQWHKHLDQANPDSMSKEQLVESIFRFALSRSPNVEEQGTFREMIGDSLEISELEDILWAIVMLPEFQYVR